MNPRRWIAHLDMDAFYASVELLRHPQLKGLPVVIGGSRRSIRLWQPPAEGSAEPVRWPTLRDYAGRGVITTATYPARALGVHSGMGLMKAAALAPDAILLPVDFEEIRKFSRLFKQAASDLAPVMEDRGIDEIYLDLSDVPGVWATTPEDPHAGVRDLARRLKQRVKEATGLSCSVGVTPNKLLSKLCSDLEKPDGLTLLTHADLATRIWPLPVGRINGIGPKASEKLQGLGITTIAELAQADPHWLIAQFGSSQGAWLHEAAHGRDDRPVVTHRDPKSMSRETTFERNLHPRTDRAALGEIFTRLCHQVADDLLRKDFVGRTVGVKLRYDDFRIVTRAITLPEPTRDADTLRRWAGRSLRSVPLTQPLRLLGVKVEGLMRPSELEAWLRSRGAGAAVASESLPLFDDL